MTYADLYNKVAASLEADQRFTIKVETARTKSGTETEWEVYVSYKDGSAILVSGVSAAEAFLRFTAELKDEPESIEETSAAVGTAEVG
jgi:hypothetical protein